jgi:hypothetical protein
VGLAQAGEPVALCCEPVMVDRVHGSRWTERCRDRDGRRWRHGWRRALRQNFIGSAILGMDRDGNSTGRERESPRTHLGAFLGWRRLEDDARHDGADGGSL